jgi:hypothetical protein
MLEDYKHFCNLQLPEAGKDRYFRLNVLDEMLQQGLVAMADGRLALREPGESTWLLGELRRGNKEAWSFFETSYPEKYARKFDDSHLAEIGREGEEWVVTQYKTELSTDSRSMVRHLSLTDDTLGYDIAAPSLKYDDYYLHIEVKTSVRCAQRFEFYLSRNEYEVSSQDPNWVLLLVRKERGQFKVFGHTQHAALAQLVPVDTHDAGSWASARLSLASSDVYQGFP